MAQHKSAEKRHRQSVKGNKRNHSVKAAVRTEVKKARTAAEEAPADAPAAIKQAQIKLARAGVKGVFHRRTVARRISRLALMQNRLAAQAGSAAAPAKATGKAAKSTKK